MHGTSAFRVEVIEDCEQARELRRRVLRPQLSPDDPLPGDEVGAGLVHFGAWLDEQAPTLISTCFVYPDPCPFRPESPAWHLRQMATAADRRGAGAGKAVLDAAVAHLTDHGARLLWCNARVSAEGFYRRSGFSAHGEVFTDERHPIPHIRMWRALG